MQAVQNFQSRPARGFSLIELVIVVVIIGIIGAIAVPRMSRGAKGASDSALTANLTVLRNALDLFATEHGGQYPPAANMPDALLEYTTAEYDSTPGAKSATNIYGPYIRAIPKLPVGASKGNNGFIATGTIGADDTKGWYYNETTGAVQANNAAGDADEAGVDYNTY